MGLDVKSDMKPSFDYRDLKSLADCLQATRKADSVSQLHDSLCATLFDVIALDKGALILFDHNNNKINSVLPLTCPGFLGDPLYAELYSIQSLSDYCDFWCLQNQFVRLTQNSYSAKFKNLPLQSPACLIMDAWPCTECITCIYVFICANEAVAELCRVVMQLALPVISDVFNNLVSGTGDSKLAALTERELEILKQIQQGLDNRSIAGELNISVNTVKSHVYNAYRKLGVNNRVEAFLVLQKSGL